ncbi:MAG: mannonate dehydratase [Rhodospirillaceae bacterium]|nr:mannonate dehydratase [Rhodospirillaceae bacterium]
MEQTWRWFGPGDPVPLQHIRQAGATGIVTALHHIPNGTVWPVEEILKRKAEIEAAGLTWWVVESIPVSEEIKTGTGRWREHLDAYCQSIRNLAACGIRTVCYNFMPVIDWTRTDLAYALPDGALALRFDATVFAAFDLFILRRPGAEGDYDPARIDAARRLHATLDEAAKERLVRTLIAGLPGAEETYTLDMLRTALALYDEMGTQGLRSRLGAFLDVVVPVAAEVGVRLAIHPDDPPRPLLGLPRIVSTAADARWILDRVDEPANGLTFCTGCYGVRPDNDLVAMARTFGERIHFLHLRATRRDADDPESFHEAAHLEGDVDMVGVIREVVLEERRRCSEGRADAAIPMRPDHGHLMLDDIGKRVNPGYSAIGRLKGLAELRGVALAVERLVP